MKPSDLIDVMSMLQVGELRRIVQTTARADLDRARDRRVAFVAFVCAYGNFIRRTVGWRRALPWLIAGKISDVGLALTVPGFVWLGEGCG